MINGDTGEDNNIVEFVSGKLLHIRLCTRRTSFNATEMQRIPATHTVCCHTHTCKFAFRFVSRDKSKNKHGDKVRHLKNNLLLV